MPAQPRAHAYQRIHPAPTSQVVTILHGCAVCRFAELALGQTCSDERMDAHSLLTRPAASQDTPLQPWQGLLVKSHPLKPQDLRSRQFAMPCWKKRSAKAAARTKPLRPMRHDLR